MPALHVFARAAIKANPAIRFVKRRILCDGWHMKRFLPLAVALATAAAACASPPIIREPGAVYLSDLNIKPLKLKVLEPAPAYFDTSLSRYAGTLTFPQLVQIEGVDANGLLRIRGNAQQGGIAAWVEPRFLEPLPDQFVENLRKSDERRIKVESLIADGDVAIGMSRDEVGRSLGKPQKKSSKITQSGTQQVWEYVKYQLVPQTTYVPVNNQIVIPFRPPPPLPGHPPRPPCGALIESLPSYSATTIYVKVPIGTLSVTFKDDIVDSIEQSEGTTSGGQVSVVIPPVNVYW